MVINAFSHFYFYIQQKLLQKNKMGVNFVAIKVEGTKIDLKYSLRKFGRLLVIEHFKFGNYKLKKIIEICDFLYKNGKNE